MQRNIFNNSLISAGVVKSISDSPNVDWLTEGAAIVDWQGTTFLMIYSHSEKTWKLRHRGTNQVVYSDADSLAVLDWLANNF